MSPPKLLVESGFATSNTSNCRIRVNEYAGHNKVFKDHTENTEHDLYILWLLEQRFEVKVWYTDSSCMTNNMLWCFPACHMAGQSMLPSHTADPDCRDASVSKTKFTHAHTDATQESHSGDIFTESKQWRGDLRQHEQTQEGDREEK